MSLNNATTRRARSSGSASAWLVRGQEAVERGGCALSVTALVVMASFSALPAQRADALRERRESIGERRDSADLETLVRQALAASPGIRAAVARTEAARLRVAPAGARPDPMLMAGVQNFPITDPGFADFMTMKMVGINQTFPYPGKLSLSARAAKSEVEAARAELDAVRLDVTEGVKRAYYELAYLDRALEIIHRNQRLLVEVMNITEARYGVGMGGQEQLLRVRVEAARLGEEAVRLIEQRRATLAALNAVLARPGGTPVDDPAIPRNVARAAVADSARDVRFVSSTLGARAADTPLPPLDTLQTAAIRQNPRLRAHEAMIRAQAARTDFARMQHLPDVDVSLSYGQRDGFSDMITATVSVPLPVQKRRKQDHLLAEARAELAAREAEHHERVNALDAEVARLYSELEQDRAQLALYVKAILPQGRAALTSATAGYQVGRTDFLSLLDSQAALFTYETTYFRVLSDFAKTLAELERVVGEEVIR